MKHSRFSEEQIISILKEHEAGVTVSDRRGPGAAQPLACRLNDARPHSGLGWQTAVDFDRTFPRRETALRDSTSSAPFPAAYPAPQGNQNRQSELRAR